MHNGLISSLLRCQLVSISGGGKLVVSLIALHQISFLAHMIPELLLKISYLYKIFANSTLLCSSSKMFPYMDKFCAKARLGTSRQAISWLFYVLILISFLL